MDDIRDIENLSADELDALMKDQLEADAEAAAENDPERKGYEDKKRHTRRGEGRSLRFVVSGEENHELMPFMISVLKDKSRTTLKSYLSNRQVCINGIQTSQFNDILRPNDVLEINLGVSKETFRHPMIRIIYEDDYIIVANKKHGLLTMATDRERQKTAYFILSDYLKKQEKNNRIFIIHRLDRETSGVLLFAKSIEVQHAFQYNWNDVVLERKYVAVVEGKMVEQEGELRSYLAENKMFQVYSTRNPHEGELAITRYKTLRVGKDNSLVELELETGKKNQIRVQMSDFGFPIIGDRRYGAGESPIGRLGLHASKIRFIHPITNKELIFDIGIPTLFSNGLSKRLMFSKR